MAPASAVTGTVRGRDAEQGVLGEQLGRGVLGCSCVVADDGLAVWARVACLARGSGRRTACHSVKASARASLRNLWPS